MANQIKNFNVKGGANNFRQRPVFPNNGGDPKPIRARLSTNSGVTGGSVKVTNPRASFVAGRQRHASIGGNAAGQEKKN